MVLVVGDKEVDNFLEALPLLVFHVCELEASVGGTVVGLDVLSSILWG